MKYKTKKKTTKKGMYVTRCNRSGNLIKRLQFSGVHYFNRWIMANTEVVNGNLQLTNGSLTLGTTGGYVTLTTPAAVGTSFGALCYQFNINGLPGATDFQNLFDSYRISKVVIKITPVSNSTATSVAGAPNGNPGASGFFHYVIDHDDVNAPATSETGIDELRQMSGYKYKRIVAEKGFTIVIKPRTAKTIYRTGVTSAYAQGNPKDWLDMAYLDIPHYGLKGIVECVNPNAMASVLWLRLETHYYLAFKGVR